MNRIRLTFLISLAAFELLAPSSRARGQSTSPVPGTVTYRSFYHAPAAAPVSGPTPAPSVAPRAVSAAWDYRIPVARARVHSFNPTGRHDHLARPWLP